MTIAGQTVTVTQDGGAGNDCQYSISPPAQTFSSSAGSGTLVIAVSERCSWQAAANVPWITITSSPNGIGNGSVTFSVATHSGSLARKGTITIGSQVFNVKQKGASTSAAIHRRVN